MKNKLRILLIISILEYVKPLILHQHTLILYQHMRNLYTNFIKILNNCKEIAGNLVNERGNIPRCGVVPKFSDLEIIALSLTSEIMGIDSESHLFSYMESYKSLIPNLVSRRQYNDRRKYTADLCNKLREKMSLIIDGGENIFCIDSKPIEICRISRAKRCRMGKDNYEKAPSIGYCATQGVYYYGYKLHAICGVSGVIHSFDLTKANVHDIKYLNDVKFNHSNC